MSRIFGPIRQNGYVVRDIHAAMKHWIEVIGVGPWFYIERFPFRDFRYRGQPSSPAVSIALANSGYLQIELIQQHDDAPSMFRDFIDAGHEGLQHVAYWPDDIDAMVEPLLARGYEIGQSGISGEMGRFLYLSTEAHPGTVVEVSHRTPARAAVFDRICAASEGWDGSDPIRTTAV
jgi:hypothetical protein